MAQISVESIKSALQKVDSLDEVSLDKLIETYTLKQQSLVDYILQAGVEFENEDISVYAIYYFAVVYEAFHIHGVQVQEISEEDIEEFHEPFLLALDAIQTDEDFEPMQDLINQHHLQQFMVDEIEGADENGEVLEEDAQTQLFIVTISMIGLLNKSSKP